MQLVLPHSPVQDQISQPVVFCQLINELLRGGVESSHVKSTYVSYPSPIGGRLYSVNLHSFMATDDGLDVCLYRYRLCRYIYIS